MNNFHLKIYRNKCTWRFILVGHLQVHVCLIPATCFQPNLGTKTHETIYSGKRNLNPLLDYLAGEEQ